MQHHNHQNRPVVELITRHPLPEPRPVDYWPARYWGLLLMGILLVACVYLFLNAGLRFDAFQTRVAVANDGDAAKLRVYNQKLESLQNRMTVFVADSVETKIKSLEKNIESGTVGAQEISALEELKAEVKLLEKYSVGGGGHLTDLARLDHPRFRVTPGSRNPQPDEDLLYEVSRMKYLLYFGIASCGLVGLMLGGYWWQTNARIKRLSAELHRSRLLARKIEEDF